MPYFEIEAGRQPRQESRLLNQRRGIPELSIRWLRGPLRASIWKQWRLPSTRIRKLKQLAVRSEEAVSHGNSRKGPWRMSRALAISIAMTTQWLTDLGLFSLSKAWSELSSQETNRLVRIRLLGGVGGRSGN